jgi:hypothetical protein
LSSVSDSVSSPEVARSHSAAVVDEDEDDDAGDAPPETGPPPSTGSVSGGADGEDAAGIEHFRAACHDKAVQFSEHRAQQVADKLREMRDRVEHRLFTATDGAGTEDSACVQAALGLLDGLAAEWQRPTTWQRHTDSMLAAIEADNEAQLTVLGLAAFEAGKEAGALSRTQSKHKFEMSRQAAEAASEGAARVLATAVSTKEAELAAAKAEALEAAGQAARLAAQTQLTRKYVRGLQGCTGLSCSLLLPPHVQTLLRTVYWQICLSH